MKENADYYLKWIEEQKKENDVTIQSRPKDLL